MTGKKGSDIAPRAFLLGILLIPINCYWMTVVEVRWNSLDGSCVPLLIEPVFSLFVIVLLNYSLRKFLPALALSQGELLIIYTMMVMGCAIAGHDVIQNLFGSIGHAFWFATEENEWNVLFFQYIPRWLVVDDKSILKEFYEGGPDLYTIKHIKAWVIPLAFWSVFLLLLIFMMSCINVIIRKRWTENERLAFPIVQLPVEMLRKDGASKFFRSRVMWMGFGVAAFINIVNGFHLFYPSIPSIPVYRRSINQYFPTKPWSAMGWVPITLYPFAIGLAFFMPLDLSFSCWFFYLFGKAQNILGSVMGWENIPGYPYFQGQSSGGIIALCLFSLWASREHLKAVFKKVMGGNVSIDDSREGMRYRNAVLWLICGIVFLFFFCAKAGMSVWLVLVYFAIFFAISIAITRIRAEMGAPHEIYWVSPERMIVSTTGSRKLSQISLTNLAYFHWFNRGYRSHPMPNQLEAFKMGEITSVKNRKILFATLLASAVGLVSAYWANLDVSYRDGALVGATGFKVWVGRECFSSLQNWLYFPTSPSYNNLLATFGGLIFTFLLGLGRMRFVWWPFHPAGYALALSGAMKNFWFAFFVSWFIKRIILLRGGVLSYRKAMPFFLGLILGDYISISIWTIIGAVFSMNTFKFYI